MHQESIPDWRSYEPIIKKELNLFRLSETQINNVNGAIAFEKGTYYPSKGLVAIKIGDKKLNLEGKFLTERIMLIYRETDLFNIDNVDQELVKNIGPYPITFIRPKMSPIEIKPGESMHSIDGLFRYKHCYNSKRPSLLYIASAINK